MAATLLGILDNLSGAVSMVDAGLHYLYVNRTLAQWYGLPPDQILGRRMHDILPPDTIAELRGTLARVLGGETMSHEGYLSYPDGHQRWVKVDFVPQFDAGGQAWGFVSLINDMTARHEAEVALRRSEARLKQAQRIGSIGSWEIDLHTGQGSWSDHTYEIFGVSPSEPDPRAVATSMIDPTDRDAVDAALADLIAYDTPFSCDYRVTLANGERRVLHEEAEVERDATGRALSITGTVQDVTQIRYNEVSLHENQVLLETGQRLANMGTFEWDVASGQIKWSRQMWDIHGLPPQERAPTNDVYTDMIADEDKPRFRAICDQIETTGAPYEIDFRIIRPDGEERTLHEIGFAIPDENGRPVHAFGSTQDITEREKAAQILRSERAFADMLIDSVPAIVLLLSPEGKIQRVNRYFEELTGYRMDEIRGKDWVTTFIPERDRTHIRWLIATATDQPSRSNINPIITRGGEEREIEWSDNTIRDRTGHVLSLLALGHDITDRLRMEDSLRTSEARLRQAQAIARIGSWELDIARGELWWSDEIYRIFELSSDAFEPSYDTFLNAIHPDDRQIVNAAYSNSLARREPYDVAHRLLMADGRVKWVEERCQTSYDAAGQPLRSTGTMQDITELKNAEDEFRRLAQESARLARLAEQANRAKSEFLATMSHELRTPLNAVIGFSESLLHFRNSISADQERDYLTLIARSGQHLLTLINDILDLAKVESGHLDIIRQPTSLPELVSECVNYLAIAARERNITFHIDLAPIEFLSDRRILKQLLVNLLSNAVKFNRDGGAIHIRAMAGSDTVIIVVEDTGIGMTEAEIERALLPFVQIESTYQRTREGTGLGLTLVQRFTMLLGGKLSIQSQKGVGTRISIELPLVPPVAGHQADEAANAPG